MWGTISPTNPIQPLTATAEDVSTAVMKMSSFLTAFTFTPSVIAELSPIIMAFRGRANIIITTADGISTAYVIIRSDHSALPRPPSIQNVACRTCASLGAV